MNADPACVYCRRRPVDPVWRPFCSERCRMADLGRWLGEDYRVPGSAGTTDDERDSPLPDSSADPVGGQGPVGSRPAHRPRGQS